VGGPIYRFRAAAAIARGDVGVSDLLFYSFWVSRRRLSDVKFIFDSGVEASTSEASTFAAGVSFALPGCRRAVFFFVFDVRRMRSIQRGIAE